MKLAIFLAAITAAVLLLAQVPNAPTGTSAATGSITVMVGGQPVGSAPVLNFQSLNGNNWNCTPDATLNSIDCTATSDTATVLTKATDQAGTDHSLAITSGGNGKNYQGAPSPTPSAGITAGSLWIVFPDVANVAAATLDLGGLGPHPMQKVSGAALMIVTGGECPAGLPCILIAQGTPVAAWVVH